MKIGIIGGGTIGKAIARTYLEFVDEVCIWDKVKEKSTVPTHHTACACDLVFICLPETCIDDFFTQNLTPPSTVNYVLKSTVPVGTTRKLREKYGLTNLVHSPEFLTARCAEVDARIPAVNIVGLPTWCKPVITEGTPCVEVMKDLYSRRFPGTQLLFMSSDESEAVKLMLNSAFAVKVSLFNEFYQYCKQAGLDWETVRRGILADGRITAHHTLVPGPDGKLGFGGACLPKDLRQFTQGYMSGDIELEAGKFGPIICLAAQLRNPYDRER